MKLKALILGENGIGKTMLAKTLPKEETFIMDVENGGMILRNDGYFITEPTRWNMDELVKYCNLISIANNEEPHETNSFWQYVNNENVERLRKSKPELVEKMKNVNYVHIDSISEISRIIFNHFCQQGRLNSKGSKGELSSIRRDAYGETGIWIRAFIAWLKDLNNLNITLIAPLKTKEFIVKDPITKKETTLYRKLMQFYGSAGEEVVGQMDIVLPMGSNNGVRYFDVTPLHDDSIIKMKDRSNKLHKHGNGHKIPADLQNVIKIINN